jgi:hypothetical protein
VKFYFHPDAEAEFGRAVEYYERSQPGLGLEFAQEVNATIARISEYPDAWAMLSKNSRRCLVNRFPFGIVYQIKSNTLRIIAVAHLHRRPGYWEQRT